MTRGSPTQIDDKERVRDAADIVRVVGEHVALKAKGREFVGLCPFHDDHRPSMNVVPSKQIFHCFVCGAGGDVFSFVQKYHKMEFREALEYLAERGNITLTRSTRDTGTSEGGTPEATRADLIRANASANDFFRTILRHAEHGRVGRDLIAARGISPEMADAFQIGLSPDRWDGLLLTLRRQGVDAAAFIAAGLLKRREGDEGGLYDSFRGRLMFPIHDQIGRVVAFGARKIREEDEPKYLNSPETRAFEKSATLYGLHQAHKAIQRERLAVVTEGYTDTIACHQAGLGNAVATLGTALTPRHAARLRLLCDTVVLLFDGDTAGQKAADRAVEVFIAEELDVKIATLGGWTDAKDPDELLKRPDGLATLRRAIDGAADLLAYRYARKRESLGDAGPAALNRIVEEEIQRLVELGLNELRPLRRRFIVRQLAAIAEMDEGTIERSIPAGRRGVRTTVDLGPAREAGRGHERPRCEHLLGCLLCEPAMWPTLSEAERSLVGPARFAEPSMRRIAEELAALVESGEACDLRAVLARLDDDVDSKAEAVALAEHMEAVRRSGAKLQEHWSECVRYELLDEEKARANQSPPAADRLRALRLRASEQGGDRRVMPRPYRAV